MNTTTIDPAVAVLCPDVIEQDVLSCLKRQPSVPVSVEQVVESVAGVTTSQVEQALLGIEGPVPGIYGAGSAYVHRCRCNNLAVYIP